MRLIILILRKCALSMLVFSFSSINFAKADQVNVNVKEMTQSFNDDTKELSREVIAYKESIEAFLSKIKEIKGTLQDSINKVCEVHPEEVTALLDSLDTQVEGLENLRDNILNHYAMKRDYLNKLNNLDALNNLDELNRLNNEIATSSTNAQVSFVWASEYRMIQILYLLELINGQMTFCDHSELAMDLMREGQKLIAGNLDELPSILHMQSSDMITLLDRAMYKINFLLLNKIAEKQIEALTPKKACLFRRKRHAFHSHTHIYGLLNPESEECERITE